MTECPYCGRKLLEDERYCYFCDQDVSKVVDRINEPAKKPEKTKPISAYCVKCNKKVDIKDPKYYIMKNNRVSIRGSCPTCSTQVFRIVGTKSKK